MTTHEFRKKYDATLDKYFVAMSQLESLPQKCNPKTRNFWKRELASYSKEIKRLDVRYSDLLQTFEPKLFQQKKEYLKTIKAKANERTTESQ